MHLAGVDANVLLHHMDVLEFLRDDDDDDDDYDDDDPRPTTVLRYHYLPLLVLLALSWPVLLTLVAASVSASAWLFWLCVGSAFGVLQLAYVLHNFAMIVRDVSALTLLKTFAMLRSVARRSYFGLVWVGSRPGGGGDGGAGGGIISTAAAAEEEDRMSTIIAGGGSGGRN